MDMCQTATYFEERVGIKFVVGPELLEMPDNLGMVTLVPGAGMLNDGAFQSVQFQVALRGDQRMYADVEGFAKVVDDLIVFGDYPNENWGSWVISAYRAASGPAPQATLDQGRRVVFICTYTAQESVD